MVPARGVEPLSEAYESSVLTVELRRLGDKTIFNIHYIGAPNKKNPEKLHCYLGIYIRRYYRPLLHMAGPVFPKLSPEVSVHESVNVLSWLSRKSGLRHLQSCFQHSQDRYTAICP